MKVTFRIVSDRVVRYAYRRGGLVWTLKSRDAAEYYADGSPVAPVSLVTIVRVCPCGLPIPNCLGTSTQSCPRCQKRRER